MPAKKKKQANKNITATLIKSPRINIGLAAIVMGVLILVGAFYVLLSRAAVIITSTPTAGLSTSVSPIVVATAGDIGKGGDRSRQAATANLVRSMNPNFVIPLGDLAYESGAPVEFATNYAPYWGVQDILSKTMPIPGNHEYNTTGAAGYFAYFDPNNTGKFGTRDKGYYSFSKDNWLFLQINSECGKIAAGCRNGAAQAAWVDQQLTANPDKCVVASWHRPRVTSGHHTDYSEMNDIWNKIVARKGLVLTSHNHLYTRSKPLGKDAVPDPSGIVQFVVGTGGASFYTDLYLNTSRDAKRIESTLGILKLTLASNTYKYEFVGTNQAILDQGTGQLGCPAVSSSPTTTVSPSASPTPSNKPPVGPTSLSAAAFSGTQINLSWPAAIDDIAVKNYVLTRNGAQIYSGSDRTFSDVGLTTATTYQYKIVAVDGSGLASTGATVVAETLENPLPPATDTTKPSTPSNVRGKVEFDALKFTYFTNLSWSPSLDNVGVSQYEIKRNGASLGVTLSTSYRDLNLKPNTLYSYDIYARDAAGNISSPGPTRLTSRCFLVWCWSE